MNDLNNNLNDVELINLDNSNNFNKEELLEMFVGDNFEKFKRPFNVAGFFFTSLYMFYRKMFVLGLVSFILTTFFLNVFKFSLIIQIGYMLLVGFFVNKIYLFYANYKISKILNKQKNKDLLTIKAMCISKGGTSLGLAFLGGFIEIVVILVILFIMMLSSISHIFDGLKKDTEPVQDIEENIFNGLIIYDNEVDIKKEFDIVIPDVFTQKSGNKYSFSYSYEYGDETFNSCEFKLSAVKNYNSSKKLMESMADYYSYDETNEVKSIISNKLNWYYFNYENIFGTHYYYSAIKDNKLYLFEFIKEDGADDKCLNYKDNILKSIKGK